MSNFFKYKFSDSQQSGLGAFPETMSNIMDSTQPSSIDVSNVPGLPNVENTDRTKSLNSNDILVLLKKIKP